MSMSTNGSLSYGEPLESDIVLAPMRKVRVEEYLVDIITGAQTVLLMFIARVRCEPGLLQRLCNASRQQNWRRACQEPVVSDERQMAPEQCALLTTLGLDAS